MPGPMTTGNQADLFSPVMRKHSDRFEFAIRQRGCVASRILNDGAAGRVSALFESSFYIALSKGLVCIGNDGLDAGPLNLIAAAPAATNWISSGLRLDAKVNVSGAIMSVGERFAFDMLEAVAWRPDPVSLSWSVATLRHGLASFREACTGWAPLGGLGSFIHPVAGPFNDRSVCRFAQIPIAGLNNSLLSLFRESEGGIEAALQSIRSLIGLGPGLTPSGDDFIGGIMIALHSLGAPEIGRRLWTPARRWAVEAGNPVSLAHLDAASEGLGSAGIHRALAAIMEGRPEAVGKALAGIDGIGHSSGWDAMAGIVTTFDAWLSAHTTALVKRNETAVRKWG